MMPIWGMAGAGSIGCFIAFAELLARYRDDPIRAIWSLPAFTYAFINAATCVIAAWWVVTFTPGLVAGAGGKTVDAAKLAILAGFGALAVLRTSLLKLRMNNGEDISVGPAIIVEQFMSVVDRAVDRRLARFRVRLAADLARSINFEQHSTSLVTLCLVLLQNPSPNEEQQMASVRRVLADRKDLSPNDKTMSLLLTLLSVVGEAVLREAVAAINPTD